MGSRSRLMAALAGVVVAVGGLTACDERNAIDGPLCVLTDSNVGMESLVFTLGAGDRPYYPVIRKLSGTGFVRDIDDEGGLQSFWSDTPTQSFMARTGRECLRTGATTMVIALGLNDAEWAASNGAEAYRSQVVVPVLDSFDEVAPGVRVLWVGAAEMAGHHSLAGAQAVNDAIRAEADDRPALSFLDVPHVIAELAEVCVDPAEGCEAAADPEVFREPDDWHYNGVGIVAVSTLIRMGLDCVMAEEGFLSDPEACAVLQGGDLESFGVFSGVLAL